MNKNDKYSTTYQIGRNIGVPFFKGGLNPKIVNNSIIPSNDSVILAGNHLHVWDQCPVMCATNRTIHWLAKKEYFDGKLGLMYKYMGCIPVDRFGNTDDSKSIALEYLNNGNVIGIFPEGTRNYIKERDLLQFAELFDSTEKEEILNELEKSKLLLSQIKLLINLYKENKISKPDFIYYISNFKVLPSDLKNKINVSDEQFDDSILLPFKYGAVSLAQKTNSCIVPFGVTGNYIFNSKNLIVEFGQPFRVGDMSLDEANLKLRNEVKTIVKKNINL